MRSLAVSSAPQKGTETLYPVWSSYYLTATVKCETPTRHLRVVAACDSAVLYDTELSAPCGAVRVPVQDAFYVGAHSRHGLAWRVELTDVHGHTSRVAAEVTGARLLPTPELRVNWNDFLRIEALRRFLREEGDTILPGMRGDSCAYALMGEDHQLVLLNCPDPPKGFRAYRGPVPTKGAAWIGWYPEQLPVSLLGATEMRGARPTVYLKTFPEWSSLPIGWDPTSRNSRLADVAPSIILHEVCHASWFARTGVGSATFSLSREYDTVPDPSVRALRDAEREALLGTLSQRTREGASARLRDYLALGDAWRAASHEAAILAMAEGRAATTEGFAYWVSTGAANRLRSLVSAPELTVNPFFSGVCDCGSIQERREIAEADRYPSGWTYGGAQSSLDGLAQAQALEWLRPGLLLQAWQENLSLRGALSVNCGYSALTTAQKEALRSDARERWHVAQKAAEIRNQEALHGNELRRLERAAKAGRAVVLRLLYALRPDEVGPLGRGARPARVLDGIDLQREHCTLDTGQPCRIRQYQTRDRVTVELRTVVSDLGSVVQFTQHGDSIELASRDVALWADHGLVRKDVACITVEAVAHHVHRPDYMGTEDEGLGVARRAFVPLALLCARAEEHGRRSRTCSLTTAPALTVTVAGNFLGLTSGQITYQAMDMLQVALPASVLIPGETYAVSATLSGASDARTTELDIHGPDGRLLDGRTARSPVRSLIARGSFREPAVTGPGQPMHFLKRHVGTEDPRTGCSRVSVEIGYE